MQSAVRLAPRSSGDVLRTYALAAIDGALAALAKRGKLHVGIHEARKAMRRARAALAIAAECSVAGADAASLALKAACRELSVPRDAYIRYKTVERLMEQPTDPYRLALLERLRARFEAAHEHELARLRAAGFGELRLRLRAVRAQAAALAWDHVRGHDARATIADGERRARKAAKKARKAPGGATRHRWRRRLRHLRYQHDIARDELGLHATLAHGRDGGHGTIGEMSDRLGDEHDLHLVLAALEDLSGLDADDRAEAQALLRAEIERRVAALPP